MISNSGKEKLLKKMEGSFIGTLKKLGDVWEYRDLNRWFLHQLASVFRLSIAIGEDHQIKDLQEKSDIFIRTFALYWNSDPRKRIIMIKIAMQNIDKMRTLMNRLYKENE